MEHHTEHKILHELQGLRASVQRIEKRFCGEIEDEELLARITADSSRNTKRLEGVAKALAALDAKQ